MVHHLVDMALLEEVLMAQEVAMAHQEAVMVPEVASVAAHHLLDGMEEDAVVTVPRDLVLADHLHLGMVQTLITALRVAWPLSNDSAPIPCKISLLEEDLRLAVARLLARLSKWMNVLAVHLVRFPTRFRPTV